MKLILLVMIIIVDVNGKLVDNFKNANISIADIDQCTKFAHDFIFDEIQKLTQSECCEWSSFISRIQVENLEQCRPLLTTSIEQFENVIKMTCETSHFEYGCPYFDIIIETSVFIAVMSLTMFFIVVHRYRLADDLGGRPLTNLFEGIAILSFISYLTISGTFIYYYKFWNQQSLNITMKP